MDCGFYDEPYYLRPAAIIALTDDRTHLLVSGNFIGNGSAVGILADGDVRVDNNTVEGAATGIECQNTWKAQQDLFRNRVSGGDVGILLRGISSVSENDISQVGTGILCDVEGYSGDLRLASNALHSAGRGIVVRNAQGAVRTAIITGNVIAASIDGVLVDSVDARIDLNDFGGTAGICVHAIGREPLLTFNDFGRSCSGWVLQEWYLTVRALESADPYSGAKWSYTDRFSARVRNDAGALVLNAGSGEETAISANLTGHTIDRAGVRTNFTRYSVTVAKPHVGVGWAQATLVENTLAAIDLYPHFDLAVQDIVLPGGRPVPDQTATVEVSVIHDSTYDTFFTPVSAVNVALRDNGVPIGEKQIPRMEPNSTATVLFPWSVSGGLHNLTAVVDPDMMKDEAFEDNNAFSRNVAVNEVPVPVLAVSDRNPAAGRTVAFSSAGSTDDRGVARSLFEFGDGTDSGWTEDSTVLHVYGMIGIYEARLRVSDGENVTSGWSLPEYITVAEGWLEAGLSANSTAFSTLVPVLLSATPEGTAGAPMSYAWDFGDGASELGAGPRQAHTYQRAGNYTASVTVVDPMGRRGAASVVLTVRNRPPEAALAFAPAEPSVLGPVQFTSVSADPDGVTVGWRWDLGDGNRSSDPAPRHLYTGKGDYTVTLEVQDDSGAWSAAASARLFVRNTPPSARSTVSGPTVRTGETVRLDAGLSSDPDDGFATLAFVWSSPDGWSAAGPGASRRYDAPGRYRITLTVTDGWGASSQDTVTVQVLPGGETGEPDSRGLATALSVSAVAVFLAALFIYGRDRAGN
jgi:PKD repeat protein